MIKQATKEDISRIAEILVFTKRMNYRSIFHNDYVSFQEMQVLPLCEEFLADLSKLNGYYVYDDEFVKGLIHIEKEEIVELYVDPFFQNQKIGSKLIEYAKNKGCNYVYVLEKNYHAIRFYQKHGFMVTQERKEEYGEYIVKMIEGSL